jgi:hypothetical protein
LTSSSETSSSNAGRGSTATRIVEIAVAYLTIIGFLFYPIGLLVLTLQLWNAYPYSFSDALFAASLVPIALSAGRILDFLLWGFIAMGIAQAIAAAIARRRVQEHFAANIAPKLAAAEREDLLQEEEFWKVQRVENLLIILMSLIAPYLLQLVLFDSWRTWLLYITFVILTCIGGAAAGLLLRFTGDSPYGSLIGNWRALLVSFVFAILAGIALTGTSLPSLPVVAYEANSTQEEGQLLAHREGYWYIFDMRGTLKAIPNDHVGDVKFLQHDLQPNPK